MHGLNTVSKKETEKRLLFDNPWWGNESIDKRYQDFPRRYYFPSFYKLVQQAINRAIVLMAPLKTMTQQ